MRVLKLFHRRRNLPDDSCEWQDSCDCSEDKPTYCVMCRWYYPLNSCIGYCRALPIHTLVGWCRDICNFYNRRTR